MNQKRASLEIIAPSVEEAVAMGLADLGLSEEAVEVEVLDVGSKGLFGLGSRLARVRLTIKASASDDVDVETPQPVTVEPRQPEEPASAQEFEQPDETVAEQTAAGEAEEAPEAELSQDDDNVLQIARETVVELLERMQVEAEVIARFGEPDDERSRVPLRVDIYGDDLSILIGPRAETLNALQYIASLIIGKEVGRSVPLVVDVEEYRLRREQQLRQLARTMADQVIKTGRRQALEPMPASERRIVHIELRDHPEVYTESTGEDPRRKVVIIPR